MENRHVTLHQEEVGWTGQEGASQGGCGSRSRPCPRDEGVADRCQGREAEVGILTQLADFNGNYTAVTAGAAVGGGTGATTMRNQNGVVIDLIGTTQGVKFNLSVDGVRLTLKP